MDVRLTGQGGTALPNLGKIVVKFWQISGRTLGKMVGEFGDSEKKKLGIEKAKGYIELKCSHTVQKNI